MNFISDGVEVNIMRYGDELLGATLPDQVPLKIKEAEAVRWFDNKKLFPSRRGGIRL